MRNLTKLILFRLLTLFGMMWRKKSHGIEKHLYLTFDDGPNPEFTIKILEILKAHNVKATFFMVGALCEKHMNIVSRIALEGHAIGNHSYDHKSLKKLPWNQIKYQIEKTDAILNRFVKDKNIYIRPPKGEWGIKYLIYAISRLRRTVFWSVDPKDFACSDSNQVLNGINYNSLRDGDIILLHDKSSATVEAVSKLVPELLRRGYKINSLGLM